MTIFRKIFSSALCWLWLAILVIVIDRYTKDWMVDHLVLLEPREILPIFNLTLAFNTGAAYSFLHSASGWQNIFFSSLAVIVSVGVIVWLYRLPVRDWWMGVALSLVVGGALGNAWDRMSYGFVIDFLDFHWHAAHFAIFNIADSAISVAAVMLFLHWVVSSKISPS